MALPEEHSNFELASAHTNPSHQVHTFLTLAYNRPTTNGAHAHHVEKKGSARKGTGDTKMKWYYLGSTHFGITSEHTNPSPWERQVHTFLTLAYNRPTTNGDQVHHVEKKGVPGRALVIQKRMVLPGEH